ncbi:serpentine type 7TM GPCR chemoreceptor srw domain-containing protein [Ditylenchus destructor]|nr:serpentine type 7TM GPCR chemoreceptor srw domain-containing protein [Ditylenchus destructor]
MFHAHASVIFHATSIWLTVSLAQIRVLTIRRATSGPTTNISGRFTVILAIITCFIMSVVNVPNFLTFEVVEVPSEAFLPCLKPPFSETDDFHANYTSLPTSSLPSGMNAEHTSWNTLLDTAPNITALNDTFVNKREEDSAQLPLNLLEALILDDSPIYIVESNNLSKVVNFSSNVPLERRNREIFAEEDLKVDNSSDLSEPSTVFSVRAHENDCMKLKMAFWSNGMVFKVVPCLLLTVSIVALLNIIADVSHKRKNLAQVMKKKVPKDHTTPMLAAILSMFLIAELPQGVMLVLTGIFSSETFHKKIYLPLGDIFDLLSLLNSAIGFLIYVGMSRKFRSVFVQLFFSCLRWTFIVKEASEQKAKERAAKVLMTAELSETLHLLDSCKPLQNSPLLCQNQVYPQRSYRSCSFHYGHGHYQRNNSPSNRTCRKNPQMQSSRNRFTSVRGGRQMTVQLNLRHRCNTISAMRTAAGSSIAEMADLGRRARRPHQQRISSRFTTNDNTRTEQLSHYPSTASMPLSNACAAATAAAAAQLGSHLLFLDPGATQHRSSQSRHTSDFGNPIIEEVSEAALDITNHLGAPASIQRDLPSIILPAVTTEQVMKLQTEQSQKPVKRISFNLSFNDAGSTSSSTGMLVLSVKKETKSLAEPSAVLHESNYDNETHAEHPKTQNETQGSRKVSIGKAGSIISYIRRASKNVFTFPENEVENTYPNVPNCSGSASPQRRRNLLQTETNYVGAFY